MTNIQKYTIIGIIVVGVLALFTLQENPTGLPSALGDPLELIVVKKTDDFDPSFFSTVKEFITIDIGPAPQPETVLKIMEIEEGDFLGIIKRHQNILIISSADTFQIVTKKNLFAHGQTVIFMECSSHNQLKKNKKKVVDLVNKIKTIEIERLVQKFKQYSKPAIEEKIKKTHNISATIPKDFFLAHNDSSTTWFRRETKTISQGIFIKSLSTPILEDSPQQIISVVDTIIRAHISGPLPKSYMTSEKMAPIKSEEIIINNMSGLKIQSLWRVENDFMGGIFYIYYFDSKQLEKPLIIYTYLFAPGERKSTHLLQLDAIVNTFNF